MRAMPDNGTKFDVGAYIGISPRLDFEVNFTATGTHYIWIRGIGPNGQANALHVGLNANAVPSAESAKTLTISSNSEWTKLMALAHRTP